MTEAEKKRAQRARKKQEVKNAANEARPYFSDPFCDFIQRDDVQANYDEFTLPLQLAGFTAPTFEDNRGPSAFADPYAIAGVEDPFPYASDDAIGRANVVIECLLEAADRLAGYVNEYEREQLETRLAELKSSDTTDRATAISEAVRLNKMLDLLDKRVRRDFPQWKVMGV